jgi:hypothetical protein
MRRIIEQAVVTVDGRVSTPQDWLPNRVGRTPSQKGKAS